MRTSLLGGMVVALAVAAACASRGSGEAPPDGEDGGPPVGAVRMPQKVGDAFVIDLGAFACGDEVAFSVPPGTLGFNISLEEPPGTLSQLPFGIERIVDPDGQPVHEEYAPAGGSHATSVATPDHVASASVPQGDRAPAKLDGVWTLRAAVPRNPTEKRPVQGKIWLQATTDGTFHGGTLDLRVYVPVDVVGAGADAITDGIACRIQGFFWALGVLTGIGRGNVMGTVVASSYSTVTNIEEAFSLSKDLKDGTRVLPVLFTRDIQVGHLADARGVASGIPGAANTFGRDLSMILVALSSSTKADILSMVHEAGHFFGLNHTTELDGTLQADPLGDTLACTTLPPTSGVPDSVLETCPDRTNLMFAHGAIEVPAVLSATQIRILRGSPVYHALPPGAAKPTSEPPSCLGLELAELVAP